jgi:hypothetical protein
MNNDTFDIIFDKSIFLQIWFSSSKNDFWELGEIYLICQVSSTPRLSFSKSQHFYIENSLKIIKVLFSFNFVDLVLNFSTNFEIFEFLFHFNEQTVSKDFKDVELSLWRVFNVNPIPNCFEGLWSQNWRNKLLKGTLVNKGTMLKKVYP